MTEIREFLRRINTTPTCMTKVNWKTETECFKYRRLRAIIVGIKDVEVCQLAREYIINAWCYTMSEPSEEIVRRLDRCFVERNVKVLKRLHKQELDNKTRKLGKSATPVKKTGISPECQLLQEENERIPQYAIDKARTEGIQMVVEKLIAYAEEFPSNQNDRAEIIKEALLAKCFNGHIPSDALSPEWKTRLLNLGRKEMGMTFKGKSMFNISGNDQVNIGGNNGQ